jgi:hypothetical protein
MGSFFLQAEIQDSVEQSPADNLVVGQFGIAEFG